MHNTVYNLARTIAIASISTFLSTESHAQSGQQRLGTGHQNPLHSKSGPHSRHNPVSTFFAQSRGETL
jgi:hypothetical protein